MRKLALLSMVLVASVAFGAVSWSLSGVGVTDNGAGDYTIAQGSSVTLTFADVEGTVNGGFTGFTATIGGGTVAGQPVLLVGPMFPGTLSATQNGKSIDLNLVATLAFGTPATNVATVDFVASEIGSYTVVATGGNYEYNANPASLSYTVTPEPMTMALLGLGGLFVRRRKA